MSRNVNGPQSGLSTVSLPTPDGACRTQLPVLGVGVVHERADAARNRLRVLAAAERLFAQRGVPGVTMDDVAAAAGVGKGTVYRRFVDKGGLAVALLDDRERDLQQQILTGPPPLGPGADPAGRLAAFVTGYLFFLDRQLDLVLLSETSTPGARLRTGAHAFWRQHCRYLLSQAGAPQPGLRADLLLAALAADQVRHWLRDEHRDLDELGVALRSAALALTHGQCR
ncbi:MAG: TetR/AcrR family transcriptional regulator [Actinomycetota bacterium]|nr:TetR/AcrR family transcriptional regulator [Actinomycetota bacterium]